MVAIVTGERERERERDLKLPSIKIHYLRNKSTTIKPKALDLNF